jgi:hypothetical protein
VKVLDLKMRLRGSAGTSRHFDQMGAARAGELPLTLAPASPRDQVRVARVNARRALDRKSGNRAGGTSKL